ncbi:unnamed protein product [Sphacelaria rigidula]
MDSPDVRSQPSGTVAPVQRNMEILLTSHYVGTFPIKLSQIAVTSLTRELNPRGVEKVITSLKSKGWLTHNPPAIVMPHEGVPENGGITSEFLSTCEFRVLDGNHEISAARSIFEQDHSVPCRMYHEFWPEVMRILGDALNDVGETLSPRNTYDKLYMHVGIITSVQERTGSDAVTGEQIAKEFTNLGLNSLSLGAMRHWRKVCFATTPEAMKAISWAFQTSDPGIDAKCISLTYLKSKAYAQSIAVNMLVRHSRANKMTPTPKDWDRITKSARIAHNLVERIESVVPRLARTDRCRGLITR